AGAAGLAAALKESVQHMENEENYIRALRDKLQNAITHAIPDAIVNTHEPALASHLHVSFPGTDGDSLIMLLDTRGFAVATGSICHAGVNRLSHVLEAMGVDEAYGRGSLRFSLGRETTESDVDALIATLPEVIELARGV
ncbi:MAG: aminotransferase class V-fold PLP-dependent enzyme, partial [Corynebacterium sp.]|nr:aminotransferase class V-fold PLP-dependent enzyme [Corynebacterium sp.]